MSIRQTGRDIDGYGGRLAGAAAPSGAPKAQTFGASARARLRKPIVRLTLLGLLTLLGAWYFAATLYLIFHDQLLASLIARQTDMQYAYEDQIAALRTQLERETSRGLVDRQTLDTTLRDLRERGALLESRALTLETLVAHDRPSARSAANDETDLAAKGRPSQHIPSDPAPARALPRDVGAFAGETANSLPQPFDPAAFDPATMGLDNGTGAARPANPAPRSTGKRADLGDAPTAIAATTASLIHVGQLEDGILVALREPTLRSLTRLRAAVLAVGLPAGTASDVGGPFVPLPSGQSFEQNAALLTDALAQINRLNDVVAKIPLKKPLDGTMDVSSTFGPRIDPFLGRAAMHTGIDFRETYGVPVHATAGGTVTIAGSDGGYGTMVEIDHGNGLATRYAHLSRVVVAPGQKLAAGAIVGHVGSSGRATGPHLHYETRINGEPVDPTRFLKVGARLFED